jgi:hypothetical protein
LVTVSIAGCAEKSEPLYSDTTEVVADEDAYVSEEFADDNYGSETDLWADYYRGYEDDAFLYFDLSSIPTTAEVVSAELWIYVSSTWNTQETDLVFSVDEATAAWAEGTVTWNLAPISTQIGTFTGPPDGYVGWWQIIEPALNRVVQAWISDPSLNNGIVILPDWTATDAPYDGISIDSNDNASGRAPELVVHYNQ